MARLIIGTIKNDITPSYLTRTWSTNDDMKYVEITLKDPNSVNTITFGQFIQINDYDGTPRVNQAIAVPKYLNGQTGLTGHIVVIDYLYDIFHAPSIKYYPSLIVNDTPQELMSWSIIKVLIWE